MSNTVKWWFSNSFAPGTRCYIGPQLLHMF